MRPAESENNFADRRTDVCPDGQTDGGTDTQCNSLNGGYNIIPHTFLSGGYKNQQPADWSPIPNKFGILKYTTRTNERVCSSEHENELQHEHDKFYAQLS